MSSNSHTITIFNLQKSVQFFNELDDEEDSSSSEEEELQTPKTYASVLTKISDNDALGGKAKSVLRGHENNIPNICFSACGRFLVSCSIDGTCRLWNVKTGELMQTKVFRFRDFDGDDWYEISDDWYEMNKSFIYLFYLISSFFIFIFIFIFIFYFVIKLTNYLVFFIGVGQQILSLDLLSKIFLLNVKFVVI